MAHFRRGLSRDTWMALALLVPVAAIALSGSIGFPYLVFPLVIWVALRDSSRGATSGVLVVGTVSVLQTHAGHGPFAGEPWRLVVFLATAAVTAYALAALNSERHHAQQRLLNSNALLVESNTLLGDLNATLEHRVRARTQDLERERRRLEEAQLVGRIGNWEWDVASNTVYWSRQMHTLFGTDPATYVPTLPGYLDLLHPDDVARVRSTIETAVATCQPYELDHRVVVGGALHWLHCRGFIHTTNGIVSRVAGTAQDVTRVVELQGSLAHAASYDALTGMLNRSACTKALTELLASRRRQHSRVTVMFLDLDRFKWVNDSLGHDVGDQVLIEAARRLIGAVRPDDMVARFGGDEFVIICPGLGADDSHKVVSRVLAALAEPMERAGVAIPLHASIGVAFSSEGDTSDELIRQADTAMYRAKGLGGSCAETYTADLGAEVAHRFATASALRRALTGAEEHGEGGFAPAYQPIVDLRTSRVIGVEALARWVHPTRGTLLPSEFLDVAEETGLIIGIGNDVLLQAATDTAHWNATRGADQQLTVSVNVAAAQLADNGFLDHVQHVLERSRLAAELLCLELTETSLMDYERVASNMDLLREAGIRISVDDFGTGYSSLTYLRRYPVGSLKIDKSFVRGLGSHEDDTAIVNGVIDLATGLGLDVIAEGVETLEQQQMLAELGCSHAQGWLWGRPASRPEFERWLATEGAAVRSAHVPAPRKPERTRTRVR